MSTRILKGKPAPRKSPRQARSRATVEALVEAAARVLSDEGWIGFTANKVAERAGFGVGSLYQYFPNKLALLEAVRERHLYDCLCAVERCAAEQGGAQELARYLASSLIQAHKQNPRLHKTLIDEAPVSADLADPHSGFEQRYLGAFERCLAQLDGGQAAAWHSRAARLISDAMDGAIHNAARRGELDDPVLPQELARLVECYMRDLKRTP